MLLFFGIMSLTAREAPGGLLFRKTPDTAPHRSGLGGGGEGRELTREAADEKEPGQLARALTLSYSGCGQGFAPCMISLIFSRPSESRYLHRVRLLSRPLPSVYLFRHRIPFRPSGRLPGYPRSLIVPAAPSIVRVTPSVDRVPWTMRRESSSSFRYTTSTLSVYMSNFHLWSRFRLMFVSIV
jgi:hypothetical protein